MEPKKKIFKDSSTIIHVVISLQIFTSLRKPSDVEFKIIMGDGAKVTVIDIRVVTLCLPYRHTLLLININVIIVLSLVVVKLLIDFNSVVVGSRVLYDGLYMLNVNNISINFVIGKCNKVDVLCYTIDVWGICLGPKLKDLLRKVFFMILTSLILIHVLLVSKGKFTTKINNQGANMSNEVLELIHIDMCRPITPITMGEYKYFITFIDDFSKFGWIDLLHISLNTSCLVLLSKIELQRNGDVLRTVVYIHNQVPTKFVLKTFYQQMIGRKPANEHNQIINEVRLERVTNSINITYIINWPTTLQGLIKSKARRHG
ncbi:hypothetical protein CR513_37253, partial [Mucuna pruriens]